MGNKYNILSLFLCKIGHRFCLGFVVVVVVVSTVYSIVQTHERFKRTLFIKTKHNLQIFGAAVILVSDFYSVILHSSGAV